METVNVNKEIKQVFGLLKWIFVLVPIVAGLDKFTNLLTHWEQYIHPGVKDMLPFSPHVFMIIVGLVEIGAGCMVFLKPYLGGMIVAAWLVLVAVSLLASGQFFDVAVRDLVMALSAFSMAKLSKIVTPA